MKFEKNIERDKILMRAQLAGGRPAVLSVAMMMEDFKKGPDIVDEYARWFSSPQRMSYRQLVARVVVAEESK